MGHREKGGWAVTLMGPTEGARNWQLILADRRFHITLVTDIERKDVLTLTDVPDFSLSIIAIKLYLQGTLPNEQLFLEIRSLLFGQFLLDSPSSLRTPRSLCTCDFKLFFLKDSLKCST